MQAVAQAQGLIGIGLILAIAWAGSEDRRATPPWRWILGAILMQFALALLITRAPIVWDALRLANAGVSAIERATLVGSSYMFGYAGGGPIPFVLREGAEAPLIIAFQILPLVIVFSALSALFWHWGALKAMVRGLSFVLRRTLGVSGVVGLSGGANLFLGVVESPLVVRAYFEKMNRSELFAVMVLAMSTISGAILILYAQTLSKTLPDAVGHMISASIISLPAAILIARLMAPGDGATDADLQDPSLRYETSIDALVRGTMDGVQLFLAVIGIIIVMFALVALVDQALALGPDVGGAPVTLRRAFGWFLSPVMWTLGVPWSEAPTAGALMGTKAILNEYVAYLDLAALPAEAFSPRTKLIVAYALCGVANLASVGLIVSTISTLAPARRGDVASLGMKSWLAGNLTSMMTGAMIGLVTLPG
ncbi:MAG: nucleoside:proton symporter [Alphaproteobacteria bacterium]|nr:nucleoside:proton symporter [Alphaproteobacteria bacterium]